MSGGGGAAPLAPFGGPFPPLGLSAGAYAAPYGAPPPPPHHAAPLLVSVPAPLPDAPAPAPAAGDVLVWTDERVSMEEARCALPAHAAFARLPPRDETIEDRLFQTLSDALT